MSITSGTNDPAYPTLDPAVVVFNDEYMFFSLEALDTSYEGVHTVTIETTLWDYRNFNSPIQDSFNVYVSPSCNSTEFLTQQTQITNFEEVGLNGGPYAQLVPVYTLTTEVKAAEYGAISFLSENFVGGHCGEQI